MSSEVGEIEVEEGRKVEGEASEELKELYYPRRNGWNCPWHPLQVVAWAFIVFFTLFYFGFLVFYIPGAWRSIGYIVSYSNFYCRIVPSFLYASMHVFSNTCIALSGWDGCFAI